MRCELLPPPAPTPPSHMVHVCPLCDFYLRTSWGPEVTSPPPPWWRWDGVGGGAFPAHARSSCSLRLHRVLSGPPVLVSVFLSSVYLPVIFRLVLFLFSLSIHLLFFNVILVYKHILGFTLQPSTSPLLSANVCYSFRLLSRPSLSLSLPISPLTA